MADINGTSGDDTLNGTTGDDVIEGLDGDDTISGDLGDDILRGGAGMDQLAGGLGNDFIEGGSEVDFIQDGGGDDEADGGDGADYILNVDGNDILRGGAGADNIAILRSPTAVDHVIVEGGDDGDFIQIASYGASTFDIDGGAGSDRVEFNVLKGHADVTLGAGADILILTRAMEDSVGVGTIEVSDFETGPGGDRLQLLDFMAHAFTNWNHDLSPFATGHARLIQSGADTLLQFDLDGGGNSYATMITFLGKTVASFTAEHLDGYPADGTIPAGQHVIGTAGEDTLSGLAGDDLIEGLDSRDLIRGGGGDDELRGGEGRDDLSGEIGDDILLGGAGNDNLDGGHGADSMFGEAGADYIDSRRGADTIDGGSGDDQLFLERGSLTAELVIAAGGDDDDMMSVYSYGDSSFELDGGAGTDTIFIGTLAGAADIILGGGADRIVLGDNQAQLLLNSGSIIVGDFATGAAGDTIELDPFLAKVLVNWDASNPFGTGHLQLVQDGADTLLQIDWTGDSGFRTIVRFENRLVADFTAENFNGLPPNGSVPPGQTIVGTPLNDDLEGGGGDDTIDGLDGHDLIYAGGGADVLIGGEGNDFLYGEAGADRLEGDAGSDYLDGGTGADLLYGGAGDDLFLDNAGSDQIFGGDGDDTIIVQRYDGQPDFVTVDGGAGNDFISLNSFGQNYVADGGAGDDLVSILALYGNVALRLGDGADTLELHETDPRGVYGIVTVEDFAAGAAGDGLDLNGFLTFALAGWDETTNPFATGYARLVQSGADTLFQIDRSGGANSFETVVRFLDVGGSTLTADNVGYAIPAVYGSEGNDLYTVDDAGDVIVELAGGGIDEVRTSLGSKALPDRAVYVLPAFVENLTGTSAGAQGVRGNSLDNVINMGIGHDLIVLDDGGVDTVNGGGGNDFIYYGDKLTAADITNGGSGTDTVGLLGNYTGGSAITFTSVNLIGVERLALYTGGGSFSYAITMNDANVAAGGEFFVTAASLKATETLFFNGAAETNARFTVLGGSGGDTIIGGLSSDYLAGNGGDDLIYGLNGTDFILGGLGADQLRGGGGADFFRYQSVAQSTTGSIDQILDFTHSDRIDLSAIDADGNAGNGETAFNFIGTGAFGNVAGELRATESGGIWTVEGDVNGDGVADLIIQVTITDPTLPALGVSDFIL